MQHVFDATMLHRFDQAIQHEWLETNGLGGYASSTIIGAHTRRYHGLLMAAMQAPVRRVSVLSRLDEALFVQDQVCELSCNQYEGAIYPDGYIFQQAFRKGMFPEFAYEVSGVSLRKTIVMIQGENTLVVRYEVLKAEAPFRLELTPKYGVRDHHKLNYANGSINQGCTFEEGVFYTQAYPEAPPLYISVPQASFRPQPEWYYRLEFPAEMARGMEAHEDLFSPGKFSLELAEGDCIGIVISTDLPAGKDPIELIEKEAARRTAILEQAQAKEPILQQLVLAADQFLVKRGQTDCSIIAGYPWFSDWGRDSMISLPGLCLATGRYEEAKQILRAFGEQESEGMIPNRFPDDGQAPEYNTIDASLWYFVAAYKYLKCTADLAFVETEVLPVMHQILNWHEAGTRYGIHMDFDYLLAGGTEQVQLTWMDAKAGDWVVTPRHGKCVEINALWYNAWEIYAYILEILGEEEKANHAYLRAKHIKVAFLKAFWNEHAGNFYDCVQGAKRDTKLRPNQLFAISLPFPLIGGNKAKSVLRQVEAALLTPYGLRSLSPKDAEYIGAYAGDVYSRDAAYHQGTIWSWLLGPYLDALIQVRGSLGAEQARKRIRAMEAHVSQAGIGSISEVFDGDFPHAAKGCIAQAWSVAELLRVSNEYELFSLPRKRKNIRRKKRGQPNLRQKKNPSAEIVIV